MPLIEPSPSDKTSVAVYSAESKPQPIINNLHLQEEAVQRRNQVEDPCHKLAAANYACFVMIQINCCYFQTLNTVQDNGLLLDEETKKNMQLNIFRSMCKQCPIM